MMCISPSPDSSTVATGDKQRKIAIWNATNKEKIYDHGEHVSRVDALCYSPDGQGVASISNDHSLVVTRIADKKCFRIKSVHGDKNVTGLSVTADKTIFTAGQDGAVREWPAEETWDKIPA